MPRHNSRRPIPFGHSFASHAMRIMRPCRLPATACPPRGPPRLHAAPHQCSVIGRSPREPSQLHNKTLRRRRPPWHNAYSYERRHHFGHPPSSHFTMQTSRSHRIIHVLRYELQVSISILISSALRTIARTPTLEVLRTPTNMDPALEDIYIYMCTVAYTS